MTRKIDDIIEFNIDIEIDIPEDYNQSEPVCVTDYKRVYTVECRINDTEEISEYILDVEDGTIPIEDDIREYIKYEIKNEFSEVTAYEILDIYTNEYDHQSARIRVTAVKE